MGLLPCTTGEVGNGNGGRIVLYGETRKFSQATPLSHIVDILIERQAIMQTIYQAIIHQEVHAAMTSHFFSLLLQLFYKLRLIGL
jgi:hypothetical protein